MTKKILISSARFPQALGFIRTLASPKVEIYVVDSQKIQVSRFSKYVKESFVVPSSKFSPKEHIDALVELVKKEKMDYLIPSWEDIFTIAKNVHLFPKECNVFVSDYSLLQKLHHKEHFIHLSSFLGFPTPRTLLIDSIEGLKNIPFETYALKACFSRASQSVYKINPATKLPNIEPTLKHPWIAQEWIEGKAFSSYSICQNGKVSALVVYPIEFSSECKSKDNPSVSSYALSFVTMRHEGIQKWVEAFVRKINFTGQIAFDFIETKEGELYAIECNPRLTSGGFLFSPEDELINAILDTSENLIQPKVGLQRQIAMGMLFLGWRKAIASKKIKLFLRHLFTFKDIVFDWRDLKPSIVLPLLWIKYFIDSVRYKKNVQSVIMHDLDFDG